MVLEIRISNFFSIKDEVILDFRAGNIRTYKAKALSDNLFSYDDINVLKTIAIYGANASGKSNIIKAIRFCNALVFESHRHNESTVYNFKPFKFGEESKKLSSYFIRFVSKEIEYEYAFTLTTKSIVTESLYYYPNGRRAKVFERDERLGGTKKEKYSFGSSVIKRPMDVAENTSNKTLYISRASQMDRAIPKDVFNFFHQTFILNYQSYSTRHVYQLIKEYKPQLLAALRFADSDIVDFKQSVRIDKGKNLNANLVTEEVSFQEANTESLEIKTFHSGAPTIPFDFRTEESLGTQKLFFIMLTILHVVKNDKILLIDEIEDSLHTQIINYILELFNTGKKAQLIFSTHNTNLLDLDQLRKDQIWFVNKQKDGSTDLYSLYDYNDFRDTMNLEKAYLQGRFNAVPILNDSSDNFHSIING